MTTEADIPTDAIAPEPKRDPGELGECCNRPWSTHKDTAPNPAAARAICKGTATGFRPRSSVFAMKVCDICKGRTEHRDGECTQHPPARELVETATPLGQPVGIRVSALREDAPACVDGSSDAQHAAKVSTGETDSHQAGDSREQTGTSMLLEQLTEHTTIGALQDGYHKARALLAVLVEHGYTGRDVDHVTWLRERLGGKP